MSFAIVTDTSANLPSRLISQYELTVIPLTFVIDGEEKAIIEAEHFDAVSFFNAMRDGKKVTTSQITPERYERCFRTLLKKGRDVLFVGMSSGISGSFQSAFMTARELAAEFPERTIRCIDTGTASLGEGMQVLSACRHREQGKGIAEVADLLLQERPHVCSVFTVDDLKYLKGTGRLSGAVTKVGSLLSIKPILKGNEEGRIVLAGVTRSRRKAIENLAERYDKYAIAPETQEIYVAHADCPEDARLLLTLLNRNRPPKDVLLVEYEPVTGSHIGPGSLALFFRGGERVRFA